MTAPPAWPGLDESALSDKADAWETDRKTVEAILSAFQGSRVRLFEGAAAAWSGDAAEAAHAKHQTITADLQAEERGAGVAAKLHRDAASIVQSTKQQIIDNVEKAQRLIEKVNSDPQATGVQKRYFIQNLVKATHAENVQLVEAGATKLGRPPATPLNVRPADFTGGGVPQAPRKSPPKLPNDPKQFDDAWEKLSQEEKDLAYQHDHSIGNRAGMPFVDRDHYNRIHLDELQKANQAELDRLRAEHPDWADGKRPGLASNEYWGWKKHWDAANHRHHRREWPCGDLHQQPRYR
ncbi:hypothetical protein [Mycobacterium shimoidei]|uniref:hypothetical protein n=1 Tax=Mycobacterium shimoidei TaxID=29313 RepID=UPI0021F35BD4|nr:hypothetical protein [Mycobacterium shimoidei]